MSPVCGENSAPRIINPSRNMLATQAAKSAPLPGRFNRKCPPPGINHASNSAGAHLFAGGRALEFSAI